jgi:HAMP domain-containing protein
MQSAEQSTQAAPEVVSTNRAAGFFRRAVMTFILAGIPGLFLVFLSGQFEQNSRRQKLRDEQTTMRQILRRASERGNLQQRCHEEISQMAALGLPLPMTAQKSAELLRKSGPVLELYLFDPKGKRVDLPGFPKTLIAASQMVLQSLQDPDRPINEKMIAAFAGHREAVTMMRKAPSTLIDLMNGERKTWGGWWPLKDINNAPIGHLIAFSHRQGIDPDEIMDQGVREIGRLTAGLFQCGWIDPLRPDRLRPQTLTFPAGLEKLLKTMHSGKSTTTFGGCTLVAFNGDDGEILFALARHPISAPNVLREHARLILPLLLIWGWWLSGNLLGSASLRVKLIWNFVIGSGFTIAIFLSAVFLDRQAREEILIEKSCRENLEQLVNIDGRLYDQFIPLLQSYQKLRNWIQKRPATEITRQASFVRSLGRRYRGFLTGMAIVDDQGITRLYENFREKTTTAANRNATHDQLLPQLAKNILENLNGVITAKSSPGGNPISEVFTQTRGPSHWFDQAGQYLYQTLGQEALLSYYLLVGRPDGKFRAVLLTTHSPPKAQVVYLRKLVRQRQRPSPDHPYFLALPIAAGKQWPTFPNGRIAQNQVLKRFRDLIVATGLPQHQIAQIGRKNFLLSGIRGQNLDGYVLLLAQPYDAVQTQTRILTGRALGLSVIMLLLAAGIAWVSSFHLLAPLHSLNSGLKALRERDFRVRLESPTIQELALTAGQFNIVMDELRDMEIAQSVQENLWPKTKLAGTDWEITGTCVSASRLGGDHHDWFLLPDGRLVFAVGDVAGHGIPSALIVASVKVALVLGAETDPMPHRILAAIDACFQGQAGKMKPMSFWVGLFDPVSRKLTFANAGHNFPVACLNDREPFMLAAPGYPLASRKKASYSPHEVSLAAGGRIFLYSDGLVEALNAEQKMFNYDRLTDTFHQVAHLPPEEARQRIFAVVHEWSGQTIPDDDQTLVILSVEKKE